MQNEAEFIICHHITHWHVTIGLWHHGDKQANRELEHSGQAHRARFDRKFDHRLGEYHVKIEGTGVATSKGGNPNA